MEYRKLGKSGLKVSEISLGVNTFGWYVDEANAASIVNRAIELGVNYIDTADWYNQGRSEQLVGKVVKGKRSELIIATKFGLPMAEGPNDRGASRGYIMRALEASLKRLNTDYVDLYQVHFPDPTTPIEETLRALDDLVKAGSVAEARKQGLLRLEGKTYVIKDGDIVRIDNERGTVLAGARVWERIMPGAVYVDHGARCDWIVPGKLDRGGAINTISPPGITSKNCAGQATSGYLVEVKRVSMVQMDKWKKQYPTAFNREYDPASGLRFNAWVEGGME